MKKEETRGVFKNIVKTEATLEYINQKQKDWTVDCPARVILTPYSPVIDSTLVKFDWYSNA